MYKNNKTIINFGDVTNPRTLSDLKVKLIEIIKLYPNLQACRTPTRNSKGVSLLFRYYNLLYYVERRFFTSERNVSIFFEWYDSLTGK